MKALVGTVVLFWLPALHAWIAGAVIDREMLAQATDSSLVAVLGALGAITLDRPGLRRP